MLQTVFDDCGLNIARFEQVAGGDINDCYCLYERDAKYFLKVNDAGRYPGMFEKEANGLDALRDRSHILVPAVIKQGIAGQQQYLLLEWIEKGSPTFSSWQRFGTSLAELHKTTQSYFGWDEDNFIGSLVQRNTKYSSWHEFYAVCRIMPLAKMLFNTGAFSRQDILYAESFCKKLEQLFPVESPSLLHGDLWSGNMLTSVAGQPVIIDPAVYYGHREMDIGMTKLFGGFDQRFYDSYIESFPMEKGWQERVLLTQLYPLLVHAVLFGGHYISTARSIIRSLHSHTSC